jgi:hypothetical protein
MNADVMTFSSLNGSRPPSGEMPPLEAATSRHAPSGGFLQSLCAISAPAVLRHILIKVYN